MTDSSIQSLSDLNKLRSAPKISPEQIKQLLNELKIEISKAEWFTVGIMACSAEKSISALKSVENLLNWTPMKIIEVPKEAGPVFLKANQNSGEVRIRIEFGLGEGILISSHHSDLDQPSTTWGPLPLNAFDQQSNL